MVFINFRKKLMKPDPPAVERRNPILHLLIYMQHQKIEANLMPTSPKAIGYF